MRLITIRAPRGLGEKIAAVAFDSDIKDIGVHEGKLLHTNKSISEQDVIQIETATPKAKRFIEALTASSFYDPDTFSYTLRHPESIYASEPPEKETYPIIRPTADVYAELWQFSQVTYSFIIRVFIAALLVGYGMREDYMPLIIAGLLFLPYHHNMLGIAVAASIKEWRFLRQALYAFFISTLIILLGGVCIGLLMEPPILFTEFSSSPLISFLISLVIGVAAGFASVDDAGRRELIGLAATAHISVYPVWFGMKFIFGFDPSDKPWEFLLIYLMDVATLMFFAGLVYKIVKLNGEGIRRFVSKLHKA